MSHYQRGQDEGAGGGADSLGGESEWGSGEKDPFEGTEGLVVTCTKCGAETTFQGSQVCERGREGSRAPRCVRERESSRAPRCVREGGREGSQVCERGTLFWGERVPCRPSKVKLARAGQHGRLTPWRGPLYSMGRERGP